jgi:hypothetical protein
LKKLPKPLLSQHPTAIIMAKTRAKSDMDTQSFLLNAASMQVSELEGLARELDAIIVRKKTTGIR